MNLTKICILLSSFVLYGNTMLAQGDAFISLSTEVTGSALNLVNLRDTIHGSVNSSIKYRITIAEEDSLVSYLVRWKGPKDTIVTTNIEQVNAAAQNLSAGTYNIEMKGYRERKKEDGNSVYDTIDVSSNVVELWNLPTVENISFGAGTTENPTVRWSGTKVPIKFKEEGGNFQGWKTEAYASTSGSILNMQDGEEEIELTSESKTEYNVVFKAINYAPDNQTVWLSYTKECTYTIWPNATLKKGLNEKEIYYRYNGRTLNLMPAVSGGDDSRWNFLWKQSNKDLGNSQQINVIAESDASSKKSLTYSVIATNTPDGIDTPFEDSIVYTVIGYPYPKASVFPDNGNIYQSSVFLGRTVNMVCDATLGDSGSWTYSWNGNPSYSNDSSYIYKPTDSGQTETVTVTAKNVLPENQDIFDTTIVYSFKVWPTPSVTKETNLPDSLIRYNGSSVSISPIIKGGDMDRWTFKWTKASASYADQKDISIIAESNQTSQKSIVYTLVSTNSPEGIDTPYRDTIRYVMTGYPVPVANLFPTQKPGATKSTLFYPDSEELYCQTSLGNTSGWTYKWNNDDFSGNTKYTFNPSIENGTETVSVVAHNELPGAQASYDTTMTYSFRIWPTPSVTKETNLPDSLIRYNGSSVSISPIIKGGDMDRWNFKWTKASASYADQKDISIFAESDQTCQKSIVYTLVSTNSPEGIDTPYRDTIQYVMTGYPVPVANLFPTQKPGATKSTLFYPDSEELYCQTSLGNTSGWTYKWNNDDFSGNTKYTFNPSIENGTETVSVVAHNELPGAQASYDTTMTYSYRIWPTPSVTLSYKQDVLNGSAIIVTADAVGGDPEAWTFAWNGSSEGKDSIYTSVAFTSKSDGAVQQNIVLRAYNRPEGAKYESGAKNAYINIYPNPNSRKATSDYQETCGGRDVNVGLEYHGGNPDGWTLDFKEQETVLSTDRLFSYDAINDSDEIQLHEIISTLKNECGDEVWFEKKDTFDVVVYPKPVAEVDFKTVSNHYFDIPFALSSYTKGGGDWSCKWTYQDSVISESEILNFDEPQPEGSFTYKLQLENTHDGQVWFDKTYVVLLRFYSRGTADFIYGYNDAIYHERNTEFMSTTEGGFPDGWFFKWYNEKGELIDNQNCSSLEIPVYNTGNSIKDVTYTLVCENKIDDIVGSKTVLEYPFHIYPKVIEPMQSAGDDMLKRVRDIDSETLSITLGQNGNTDGWLYDWNGTGFEKDVDTCAVIYGQIQSDVKSYKDIEYTVNWKNISPTRNDEIWAQGTFVYPVRVYNTPAKPSIVQKGDGSSAIYIAMGLPLEDEELFSNTYDYTFQFGQGNNDDVEGEETSHRWHRYSYSPNRPWVRSCWHYDDFDCVSDCSYLDGSTRSITGIDKVEEELNDCIYIYSISGKFIGILSDANEICNLKVKFRLESGVYLLHSNSSHNSRIVNVK